MKAWVIICSLMIAFVFPAYADFPELAFVCDDFPPFAYSENGHVTGFSVEILRTILKELHVQDTIKIHPWARAYQTVLSNKNSAIFTMARNEEREHQFKWVGPIAPRNINLYKLKRRTDIKIRNFQDARNYTVGTIIGYAAEKELLNKGFEPGKNLESVSTNVQNIRKIYADRIDLIASFDYLIAYTVKGTKYALGDFEKVLVLSDKYDFYYAFNKKTDDAVVSSFQSALDRMKADGRYNALMNKYLQ